MYQKCNKGNMMNTKNNQRSQRTEKKIEDTFFLLCQKAAPEKITVKQLCEAVGINRSSFYAHYLDIPDLIEKTGIKYLHKIKELFEGSNTIMEYFVSQPLLTRMIERVGENHEFFDVYFNHTNAKVIDEHFSILWESSAKPYMQNIGLTDEIRMQYHFTFFKAGFISVLSRWVSGGCKEKPEEIAEIILQHQPY